MTPEQIALSLITQKNMSFDVLMAAHSWSSTTLEHALANLRQARKISLYGDGTFRLYKPLKVEKPAKEKKKREYRYVDRHQSVRTCIICNQEKTVLYNFVGKLKRCNYCAGITGHPSRPDGAVEIPPDIRQAMNLVLTWWQAVRS